MKVIKEFLKPNWGKIIIFLIIFLCGCSIVNKPDPRIADLPIIRGFPFGFYGWGGLTYPPQGISYIVLMLDIIIWYIFACLIYSIIAEIKRPIIKPK